MQHKQRTHLRPWEWKAGFGSQLVKLPGADHYVYLSNEAEVLHEMRAFLTGLH